MAFPQYRIPVHRLQEDCALRLRMEWLRRRWAPIVAHGLNRSTKDAHIWLDPLDSPSAWAEVLLQACKLVPA